MANVGFRIFNNYPRTDPSLVDLLRNIPVANIDDVMGRIYSPDSGLKSVNSLPLAGIACTVKAPAGDNLVFHRALDVCRPSDIIVVDGAGFMERSLCGEQMYRYALKKEIAGFVVDGAIRDVESLRELSFPVYARSVCANGPYKNGPGEVNIPVCIGGIVVFPGDILIGDSDGLVVIRPVDAIEIANEAKALEKRDQKQFSNIEKDNIDKGWVMTCLTEKGCEFVVNK